MSNTGEKFKQKSRFGRELRGVRKNKGISQEKLAFLTGLAVRTIRQLESGKGSIHSWNKTLESLGVRLICRQLPAKGDLGEGIGKLRKRRQVSQRHLAELAGISQPTLWKLEKGCMARLSILERVLIALGVERKLVELTQAESFYQRAGNSSAHQGWQTPPIILTAIEKVFGVVSLDPCSPTSDRSKALVKAKMYFTNKDNGLALDWFGVIYMNPPYGREIADWTSKAKKEVAIGNAQTIIGLLPVRTDTKWWRRDIVEAGALVWFISKRLVFLEPCGKACESGAPFGSVVVIWGELEKEKQAAFTRELPENWHI